MTPRTPVRVKHEFDPPLGERVRDDASMSGAVVFVHAHPDDEAIFTGGTMARLAAAGVPVVLVVATGGELGAVHPDYHGASTTSGWPACGAASARRRPALLGVGGVEFLGYHDSGMAGDAANDAPGAFCRAPVDEAAARAGRDPARRRGDGRRRLRRRRASTGIPTTSR